MKAQIKVVITLLLSLLTTTVFAAENKQWSVTVVNNTKTPVYLTELNHNGAPVYWQHSKLEPGQSEVFNTSATDTVDDIAFGFVSGAEMDAKGYYCYRDGRVSTLYTGENNIYPVVIKLNEVLNDTRCDETPRVIKAISSNSR